MRPLACGCVLLLLACATSFDFVIARARRGGGRNSRSAAGSSSGSGGGAVGPTTAATTASVQAVSWGQVEAPLRKLFSIVAADSAALASRETTVAALATARALLPSGLEQAAARGGGEPRQPPPNEPAVIQALIGVMAVSIQHHELDVGYEALQSLDRLVTGRPELGAFE